MGIDVLSNNHYIVGSHSVITIGKVNILLNWDREMSF